MSTNLSAMYGINDIIRAFTKYRYVSSSVSWSLKRRFSRTVLGVFWPPLTFLLYALALIFVSSAFFGQNPAIIAPHLLLGMCGWLYFAAVASEGITAFIANRHHLLGTRMPYFSTILIISNSHTVLFFMNLVLSIIIIRVIGIEISWTLVFVIPVTLLLWVNFSAIALIFAICSTFVRDIGPLLNSVLMIGIFVTPVWWREEDLQRFSGFVVYNPLAHLLNIVRDPIIGEAIRMDSVYYSIIFTIILVFIAALLFSITRKRLPYVL